MENPKGNISKKKKIEIFGSIVDVVFVVLFAICFGGFIAILTYIF